MANRPPPQQSLLYGTPSPLTRQASPPILAQRAPTTTDTGYLVGTLWINQAASASYILNGFASGIPDWALLASAGGTVDSLTGNSGGAIIPAAGNINVVGTETTTVIGAGSTLTITPTAAGFPITPFVVGAAGVAGYQTIQSALTAASAVQVATGVNQTVVVQAGSYTENLTLPTNVQLVSLGGPTDVHPTTIIGTHTPPSTGWFGSSGIFWQGATAIFSSAAAGSANLDFYNTIFALTGAGFSLDLANWTGTINFYQFFQTDGGTNGFINNATGSATVIAINAAIGLTQTNATAAFNNGVVEWDNMVVAIKCNYGGTTTVNANGGCQFLNTHTFAGSSSGWIINSAFQTGANPAITYSTSGNVYLADVNINSSANPCITGAGAGVLTPSSVTFVDNAAFAGTLTLGGTSTLLAPSLGTSEAANALTATSNSITASGSNTNIDLLVNGKGSGGVLHSRGRAAGDVTIEVTNTDNTNPASRGGFEAAVGGTSAGDPYLDFLVSGAGHYVMGIDNSVTSPQADPLVLSAGGAIGTNNLMVVQTAGQISMPLQPAFLGFLGGTVANKTGNGTAYTIGTDALTEVYDQGSNFTTAGVFTAPVTGVYDLRAQVTVTAATNATTFVIAIVTSARTYQYTFIKAAGGQDETVAVSTLADMAATNTAHVTITVSGEAGDTDSIKGGATLETYFCGKLAA